MLCLGGGSGEISMMDVRAMTRIKQSFEWDDGSSPGSTVRGHHDASVGGRLSMKKVSGCVSSLINS